MVLSSYHSSNELREDVEEFPLRVWLKSSRTKDQPGLRNATLPRGLHFHILKTLITIKRLSPRRRPFGNTSLRLLRRVLFNSHETVKFHLVQRPTYAKNLKISLIETRKWYGNPTIYFLSTSFVPEVILLVVS